ncbi:MAG: SDR family oxidoreductase [Acidimicrobiales bacterium]|nr:SDR family oxidoreductase [Acidimicrobiales bacterium]
MSTIFFTGFPGFLGVQLLPRVLQRSPDDHALCLVQAKFADLARRRVDELVGNDPSLEGRIKLVEGDITLPNLGLDDPAAKAADLSEVWHLAAVYDLSVPREIGMRINVDGTRHVLDFAESAPGLSRLQYVSTCYVSGRYAGIFKESDLDKGQRFNNFYEETKFLAEVDVQERMKAGLPATIYRPAIVVGDSTTGETQKYDGPYFALQWLLRQPFRFAVMPVVGDPTAVRLNVVPRDFVVSAIAQLSGDARSKDKVYQLADPNPLTIDELLTVMGEATGKRLIRIPLTKRFAKFAVEKIPGVYQLLRIPSDAIDYFTHPTFYDTTNTSTDLEGTGVSCPSIASYLPSLVAFMKVHPGISATAMI